MMISFPQELIFLTGGETFQWEDAYARELHIVTPFIYEAAVAHGIETIKPWATTEMSIPALLLHWNKLEGELVQLFSSRSRNGMVEGMNRGISYYYEFLFWIHQTPVDLRQTIRILSLKPVNVEERIEYINSNRTKYHSFIQLSELFRETEKIYNKQKIMQKRRK